MASGRQAALVHQRLLVVLGTTMTKSRTIFCSGKETVPCLLEKENAVELPPSRLSARTILNGPAVFVRQRIWLSWASETLEEIPNNTRPLPLTAAKLRRAARESFRP